MSQFRREHDAHNDTVDSDDLAENNGDQVLGADAWRFDTTTKDRSSGDEDSPVFLVSACCPNSLYTLYSLRWFVPCGANNGEADAEADACGSPGVRRNGLDERADLYPKLLDACSFCFPVCVPYVECLAFAIKQHVCQPALALGLLSFQALEFQTYRVR